jgi:hypothetical protein
VERAAAAHAGGQALWPGYDPLAVPLAVYDGERTFLFRHPSPPPEYRPVPGAVPTAVAREGRDEAMTANSSAEIGGVQTATVLLDRPGGSGAERVPLALHEAFHVFQRARHPRWGGNEADLFVYPTDDAGQLALRRLESDALRRALSAGSACWARQALALRSERYARLDSASAAYEQGTELNEGLAAYVEARAGGRATVDIPADEFAPAAVRLRAYSTGPALAFLLDRFAPGWPQAFEADDSQTLDGALRGALGAGDTCPFDAAETMAAARRAEADVAALVTDREQRVAAFESAPGWHVVLDAAESPLWPQGFDPLNVERVGPGRVLHTRFVRLGSASGHLEVLDTGAADIGALTRGGGPHPLFNGVTEVGVSGLQEPVVSEADGVLTIRAPGLVAEFRGASVTQSGQTLRVHLGP